MTIRQPPQADGLALLTDLYQLTMALGYWKVGRGEERAVFHHFFRENPFRGSYAVAAGLADRAQVQLAYAIGLADPVSVLVDTFGTGRVDDNKISDLIRAHFALTPKGIIETLNLRRPIYKQTAAFGHFGRTEQDFTWEWTDKAEALKADAGL